MHLGGPGGFVVKNPNREAAAVRSSSVVLFPQQPALQLIYDTAPIGLACLSPDCRYLQINQRLTERQARYAPIRPQGPASFR
jgi:hypothetical protein